MTGYGRNNGRRMNLAARTTYLTYQEDGEPHQDEKYTRAAATHNTFQPHIPRDLGGLTYAVLAAHAALGLCLERII